MPDYLITPNPETHEFRITYPLDRDSRNTVTLFPRPRCTFRFRGETFPCMEWEDTGSCFHTRAVERALIDARNAPETEANRRMIETAYIPLKVACMRADKLRKRIDTTPIDEAVKRQDWMD